MGFTIYYRSTKPVKPAKAEAIRAAAAELVEGRTWLSCEPVGFFSDQEDGRLIGGSKPNFQPHPDDVAAAAKEALPDGTVTDLLDILCQLSADFGVDWEFSHDHDAGPIGFVRGGMCEPRLRDQMEALGDLGNILQELMDDTDLQSEDFSPRKTFNDESDDDEDDPGPAILKFRPRGE
jgi:hypothetical protein